MIPLAHVGGLPIEEVLLPLVYGGTGVWAALRMRLLTRTSRRRRAQARRRRAGTVEIGPRTGGTRTSSGGGRR